MWERDERRRLDILELESAFNGIVIALPSGSIHLTLLRGYEALSCLNSAFRIARLSFVWQFRM